MIGRLLIRFWFFLWISTNKNAILGSIAQVRQRGYIIHFLSLSLLSTSNSKPKFLVLSTLPVLHEALAEDAKEQSSAASDCLSPPFLPFPTNNNNIIHSSSQLPFESSLKAGK